MKICTATYHHEHNYGAMLQAYALQQCLLSIGYENEIIDYVEHTPKLFKNVRISFRKQNLSAILYNIKVLLRYKKFKLGFSRFEEFYQHKMKKTKAYYQYKDLKDIGCECDLLLAGSDQLWNFKNRLGINEFFTFSFNDTAKKATYAISMGGYHAFSNEIKKKFDESLEKFSCISAREADVITYLNEAHIDVKTKIHIDPVFLLDKQHWSKLADECKAAYNFGEYIVCYELIPNPVMNIILEKLKSKFGYKVVIVAPNAYSKLSGDYIVNDAGPMELLKIIRDAKYVVSTSFHGIAFSIIFNKPFYAVLSNHAPGRIKNLLQIFGFENKGISDLEDELDSDYDYSKVDMLIKQQQKESIKYLNSFKTL